MKKEVSIVLSRESRNARKVAQRWYGLTDEQMIDMDVHHNPPVSEGGRNIPEHLYVYHNTLHTAVHEHDFVKWSRVGGQRGGKKTNQVKNEEGKSVHGLRLAERVHAEKDENNKSKLAVKRGKLAHEVKTEDGRSAHAVKCAEITHKERDELGRSLHTLKLHEEKDELGRSVQGVKCSKYFAIVHEKKDELGRSLHTLNIHREKNEFGKSVLGIRNAKTLNSQRWVDPEHPELGAHSSGTLARMQSVRGYPHGPENRVKVSITEDV